ncbi:MAG: PQQ-binding-like beta-propeller repeat protein, partial [Planctomycetota bacterium]|nr:PQQ-binding-like beta-propeller repeat protein [Planctomycetota bacterium]
ENGQVLWNYTPPATGRVQAIDSSPAVVGDRVYFGVSAQSPFRKSGALYCVDTAKGALAWKYTGDGELNPGLQPVFSSPAIGGEFKTAAPGEGREGRYLVTGEGYHDERNCRFICLDLEPVRTSRGQQPPRLHWARPTTSHVESSPCIFEGKAYVGAGDDGVWCVDLETGQLKWRLEGAPFYLVKLGEQARTLPKFNGKTIVARGTVERWPREPGVEPTFLVLDIKEFAELADPARIPPEWAGGAEKGQDSRTVVGKVAYVDSIPAGVEGASGVKIEIAEYYPDAESSPIGVRIPKDPANPSGGSDPRLFFGCGIGGQAVVCVNADTGQLLWRTKTAHPAFGEPAVVDGKVLIGLSNGTFVKSDPNPAGAVLCLSAADGKELWQVKTGDGILGAVPVKNGVAYACSRDGNLYVIDAVAGKLLKTYSTGATMVCSPAVTDHAVYMTTAQGKVFCIKRPDHAFAWSVNLTPGQPIYSSPAVAGNKLFVGSGSRGLFCVSEAPGGKSARKSRLWSGPGGDAARSGCADDRGPPAITGDKAQRLLDASPEGPETAKALIGVRLAARPDLWQIVGKPLNAVPFELVAHGEQALFAPLTPGTLACIARADLTKIVWQRDVGGLCGAPCVAHNLILLAVVAPPPNLLCLDDATGTTLWEAALPAAPVGPPTVLGDKVFIGAAGKDAGKGQVFCRRLTDGSKVWDAEASEAPASYIAASGERLAFATAGGRLLILKAENGEEENSVPVGSGAQAPAFAQNTLILAAENRVGAFDASTGNWLWSFDGQDRIGRALAPPILLGEVVWLNTEKLGLIAIGQREKKGAGE